MIGTLRIMRVSLAVCCFDVIGILKKFITSSMVQHLTLIHGGSFLKYPVSKRFKKINCSPSIIIYKYLWLYFCTN